MPRFVIRESRHAPHWTALIAAVAALTMAGCDDEPKLPPKKPDHSVAPAGGAAGWRNVADATAAVRNVCTAFQTSTLDTLSTAAVNAGQTQQAATPGFPTDLRGLVGDYYRGSLEPDTHDRAVALAIRRDRVTGWCGRNGL